VREFLDDCDEATGKKYVLSHINNRPDDHTVLNVFIALFARYPHFDEDMWEMCKKAIRYEI